MTSKGNNQSPVLVVGAGPVGLLIALMLAKLGIAVTILEATSGPNDKTRALLYGVSAVKVLQEAGVADLVREAGWTPGLVTWRKLGGDPIVGLDSDLPDEVESRPIVLAVGELINLLYGQVQKEPLATVLWSHEVTEVGQVTASAWVEATTPEGPKRLTAEYVVGSDGANSIVRRSLFGMEFPGTTWDFQLVATNIRYPFEKYNYTDANFIIDQQHGHMCARIDKKGLWRLTYREEAGISLEECQARLADKFAAILPAHPSQERYELEAMAPYRIHQRVAPSLRVGRLLLSGDAAHLNNPFGGLGLTNGITGAGALVDCLAAVISGQANEDILDKYSEVRRKIYSEIVDFYSTANLKLVMEADPETALLEDPFLQACKRAETDGEVARALKLSGFGLYHDFKQYYIKT